MLYYVLILMAAGLGAADTAQPAIVAHRGAMSERPENTMAAFERAVELGADVVEIDVRLSADGVPFILHDATLDRTTDGTGRGEEQTLDALRALDAGTWFDESYTGERIPTLAEVLAWARERTTLLLDLKGAGPEFADAVAADVRKHGEAARTVIGVRSVEQAQEFRERLPDAPQLGFMRSPDDIEPYAEAGVDILRLWLRWLEDDQTLAHRVREADRRLMINGTHGELDEARTILEFSPDWILIDDVAQLRQSLAALLQED